MLQMNLNIKTQQKTEFKSKVNDLMQEYERQKKAQMQQKQQMKKQIMISIINSKQKKSQSEKQSVYQQQNTFKTSFQQPQAPLLQVEDKLIFDDQPIGDLKSIRQSRKFKQQDKSLKYHEKEESKNQFLNEDGVMITFNEKREKKTFLDPIYLRKDDLSDGHNVQADNQSKQNKSMNIIEKYSNKYLKSNIKHISSEEFQFSKMQEENITKSKIKEIIKQSIQKPVLSYSQIHADRLAKIETKDQQQSEDDIEEQYNEPQPKNVFLTMEQSQSMTAEELPKNYVFEIKMDKQLEPSEMEKLKKMKIQEMEKKRMERIIQFRRNESQKKVDIPKGKNHSIQKNLKEKQSQISEFEKQPRMNQNSSGKNIQRSTKAQQKSQKIINKYYPKTIEVHESHYNIKGQKSPVISHQNEVVENKFSRPPNQSNQYENRLQNQGRTLSPHRTPKSVVSQARSKNNSRANNIFGGQSTYSREKSGPKFGDPKIQIKDRKNSFNRQSNKKLMINAITYVCFPGQLNRKDRQKLTQILQSSEHEFFIFLFKEYSRKIIKGIYILDQTQSRLDRIYGDKAPLEITSDRVQQFYRFDSGSRDFKKVDGCRSFSFAIHAIDLR